MEELPLSARRASTTVAESRNAITRVPARRRTTAWSSSSGRARSTTSTPRASTASGCTRLIDSELEDALCSSCASTSRSRARRWAGRASSTTRTSTARSRSTRACARARPAAVAGRAGPAGRLRVPRHDHAAVHRRPRELGRDRRAHDREPGAPRAGVGPVGARRLQERHRRQHRRSRSTPCSAASHPHQFLSVTKQGLSAIVATRGNPDCHVILRGSSQGPNYERRRRSRAATTRSSQGGAVTARDGRLQPRQQPQGSGAPARVVRDLAGADRGAGSRAIFGVMIESHLVGGRQDCVPGKPLVYGQSITDACLAWDATAAAAARARFRGACAPRRAAFGGGGRGSLTEFCSCQAAIDSSGYSG